MLRVPFGLTARQQNAWMMYGGGLAAHARVLWPSYNVVPFPRAIPACQMGGWFRKEIKTLDDLKGLKMRIAGIGGRGAGPSSASVPQQIAGGDIYPALETRHDRRRRMGRARTTTRSSASTRSRPYYYYPGFWEAGTQLSLLVGKQHWDALPPAYKRCRGDRVR